MQLAPPGVDTITWRGSDGHERSELASPALLHERLADCAPYRAGMQYQNRRNRHSRQFFAPQGSHVWCESALEAEALLFLDFEGDVQRIVAQPMKITFADGTHHFPDFFALLRNRDQVVYDVKPSGRMTADAAAQFAKTAGVCTEITRTPESVLDRARDDRLGVPSPGGVAREQYAGIEYGGLPVNYCI